MVKAVEAANVFSLVSPLSSSGSGVRHKAIVAAVADSTIISQVKCGWESLKPGK